MLRPLPARAAAPSNQALQGPQCSTGKYPASMPEVMELAEAEALLKVPMP